MTQCFVPVARRLPPAVATADIAVEAPPSPPPPRSPRWLPVVVSIAGLGVMAAASLSGSTVARSPTLLAFPAVTLISVAVAAARGQRQGRGIDADRLEYLGYLSRLRATVTETASAQRFSLMWSHPDPDTLWTLIGGPRMWERRASDPDFCVARVGLGTRPLSTRLVAPESPAGEPSDPVTAEALRRFLQAHSVVADAPVTVGMFGVGTVTIEGDLAAVRGLLRAVICQLAVLHPPDQLLIAGAISDPNRERWEWLKWLPHNQHPTATAAMGSARMVYRSLAEAQCALGDAVPHAIVVVDLGERATVGAITAATLLEVGARPDGTAVMIRRGDEPQPLPCPDRMELVDALTCARRLAAYRVGPAGAANGAWPDLVGLGDLADFDPITLSRGRNHRDRLRVPLGTTLDGAPLELDIKEAAENGMGPHGLCVGATGSGKSELLRTIALGMVTRNSPEALNLLLIDFKGGATFLDLARAPHVAAVVTNLADEAPLVARMRDALGGEMDRRQRVLRTARCASVGAYEGARVAGGRLDALPTLMIIIDEFSEMLSQHPEFADVFVAIGRLGRSLGMHLLLASQRLDEGRLRGLEAHLSYRICLKTMTAAESRAVMGTPDAYQLPNTPGVGLLRAGSGEPIRFQAAFVSGALPADRPADAPTATARVFSTRAAGPVTRASGRDGPASRTVLESVLDRLTGLGPPAHQVWLPPLGAPPALDALLRDAAPAPGGLTVPIGVVDRPFDQRRTPLMVELSGAAGNVAIVGAPQTGKSTALRTLVTAFAATYGPGRVQFYCLDFGGGALGSVGALPHVGAVAGRAQPELVRRVVAEMESVARQREDRGARAAGDSDPFGDVFLVVDGWASLRQEFEELEAPISSLAAQGLSFGVHVVLSASRWAEIRPSLRDQIGTRIELRLGDPAESDIDRKRAQQVPPDRPGRGLSREGLHMVIALPTDRFCQGGSAAPPIPLLPRHVAHDAAVQAAGAEFGARILLGLEERGLAPVPVDFGNHSHLVILGENECGKTTTLRTLCREIVRTKTAAEARLLIVDFRRSLLGVVESEHLGGYAASPAGLGALVPDLLDVLRRRTAPPDAGQAQLRAGSCWSGPDLYVLVDDYDLVATPAGNALADVAEFLPYAKDLGLHLVVARRSGGAERAQFEPLLAALRDLGCMTLMMSGCPDERVSWGSGRPQRLPTGRGVLRTRAGDERLVQVAWSPPP